MILTRGRQEDLLNVVVHEVTNKSLQLAVLFLQGRRILAGVGRRVHVHEAVGRGSPAARDLEHVARPLVCSHVFWHYVLSKLVL